ncbi:MAG TPA: SIS domain-containing protein, partial [Thermoanaerobaculia bacterium]|nr:SIS domain-containing protein [Thermoanaerobaculia bacterium]
FSGAQTLALTGTHGSYATAAPSSDPYLHQEILEVLHHTLCETVHHFLDGPVPHEDDGDRDGEAYEATAAGLDDHGSDDYGSDLLDRVSSSILARARQAERLREQVARESAEAIATVAEAIRQRISGGGRILLFGNGGSATDANDWALDCSLPLKDFPPLPALSLAAESSTAPTPTSAIPLAANGNPGFVHQLASFGRPEDVAVAISTTRKAGEMVRPLERSRQMGMLNVALLGHDGGDVVRHGLADHPLVVHSEEVPRIQEVHASIYHTILEVIAEG